jgi:hypothetical protein
MKTIISRVRSWGSRRGSRPRVRAQRAELHLDLPDTLLVALATRSRPAGGA